MTAKEIKYRIRTEIGEYISASIGIGINMFLAKLGASFKKPDGLVMINHINLLSIYEQITLLDINGINIGYQARLNHAGIYTPLDMFYASRNTLRRQAFHSILGEHWYYKLRGWESDQTDFPRKTYGHQYALGKKTKNPDELFRILMKLCEKMGRRLRRAGYVAFGIHVALRYANYIHWHLGKTFNQAVWTTGDLYNQAQMILSQAPLMHEVLLISVNCFNLQEPLGYQENLYGTSMSQKLAITQAVNKLNDKIGEFTITPARMMRMQNIVVDRIAFGRSAIDETSLSNMPTPFVG